MKRAPKTGSLETVYLPAEDASEENPILVVLHGLGDSIEGYRFLPQALGISKLSYLLVNAPDQYFVGYSWFDLMGDMTPGIIRSRELLFGLLNQLRVAGWNSSAIGILGFSQGCVLAVDAALRYPEALGGIVGISGFVSFLREYPAAFSPVAGKQKILMTHGTQDPMVPIRVTREQAATLKGLGLNLQWAEFNKEHTIDPVAEIPLIRKFLLDTLPI